MFFNKKKKNKTNPETASASNSMQFNFDINNIGNIQNSSDYIDIGMPSPATNEVNVNQVANDQESEIKKNQGIDFNLVMLIFFITIFGLVVLYSASSYYSLSEYNNTGYLFERQLGFMGVGIIMMFVVSLFSYKIVYRFGYIIYLVSKFY